MGDRVHLVGTAINVLIRSGWSPERAVNHTSLMEYMGILSQNNYHVFQSVVDFLRSFGGVILEYEWTTPIEEGIFKGYGRIAFDIEEHADWFTHAEVKKYENIMNQRLCLIGIWGNQHTGLMMDENGKVYGMYEDSIIQCGSSGYQSVINMLNDEDILHIHAPHLSIYYQP